MTLLRFFFFPIRPSSWQTLRMALQVEMLTPSYCATARIDYPPQITRVMMAERASSVIFLQPFRLFFYASLIIIISEKITLDLSGKVYQIMPTARKPPFLEYKATNVQSTCLKTDKFLKQKSYLVNQANPNKKNIKYCSISVDIPIKISLYSRSIFYSTSYITFHHIQMNEVISEISNWANAEGPFRIAEHIIVLIVVIRLIRRALSIESRGRVGLVSYLTKLLLRLADKIGFIRNKKEKYLQEESTKNAEEALIKKQVRLTYDRLPQKGLSKEEILSILDKRVNADINPTEGKTFAYVYEHSKAHSEVTEACFVKYLHHNALNPIMFNSLRVIENEVVRMAATLFHGDENSVGNVTSCGTESLLLAMKTYRDYRGPGKVIMCTTGHPGINKGCSYVGLEVVQIPYDENKRMSLKHLKSAISSSTVLVVCSAPQYPNGVVDDVPAIAAICRKYGVPLHVDSAIGGFVLPFIQMEGKAKFKPFDFRVEGVTSINADVHKYGYAPKGSSVLIYRNSVIRRHQYFSFATWPGGIYISPTAMGTRNGGCLSAAWGSLLDLGIEGFRKITAQVLVEVQKFVAFIKSTPELQLLAEPDSTIISFKCKSFSCYKLADALESKGLYVEKQSNPESIHMTLMPNHIGKMQDIMKMITVCLKEVQANPNLYELGSKAVYGMMAKIPDEAITEDFVVHYMDKIYKLK